MELEDLYKRKFSGRDLLAIMDSNDVQIGVGATLMIVEKIDKAIEEGHHRQWDFPAEKEEPPARRDPQTGAKFGLVSNQHDHSDPDGN